MPKALSDNERAYIQRRLKEEAEVCLTLYGVRKTTVDELVKRVHIPKGTFYLFYESKERLFYDVLMAFHSTIQTELMQGLRMLVNPPNADAVTDLIFSFYRRVEESFLLRLMTGGELEMLMQKLPPELIASHAENDDLNVEQLIAVIPGLPAEKVPFFSAALRAVFLSMLHKREVGEQLFDKALYIMVRGIVLQLFETKGETI